MTDATTHALREDTQRLVEHPDCLGASVDGDHAELEYMGTALAPEVSGEIADLDRHISSVTQRAGNTLHVKIR